MFEMVLVQDMMLVVGTIIGTIANLQTPYTNLKNPTIPVRTTKETATSFLQL